ncbi:hypothetical protein [Luteolibacter sp. Populi]|uniref:hypothetical protein n=1 Tax=Luteolibacter sp. Populi TaxID=3230487 RepID=UPI0034650C03
MRRGVILVLLLASHAAAWWLAGGVPREVGAEAARARASATREAGSALDALLAKAAGKDGDEEQDEDRRFRKKEEAALAKFSGDPAALLAGVDGPDLRPEDAAAFRVWLESDALAALRWAGERARDHSTWELRHGMELHVAAGGRERLDEYLRAVPQAREFLLKAAGAAASKGGPDFALGMAAGLSGAGDRLAVLTDAFPRDPRLSAMGGLGGRTAVPKNAGPGGEQLAGHIAAVFSLLDESGRAAFVGRLWEVDPKFSLAREVREAGLSANLLARYEESLAGRRRGEEEESEWARAERAEVEAMPPSEWLQFQADHPDFGGVQGNVFEGKVQGLEDWCAHVVEGRMTADEVLARVKAAVPEFAGMERELRVVILRELLPADPELALAWLRQNSRDWQAELPVVFDHARLYKTAPETLGAAINAAYGQEDLPDFAWDEVHYSWETWLGEDREGCEAAIRQMRPGSLKDALLALLEGESE